MLRAFFARFLFPTVEVVEHSTVVVIGVDFMVAHGGGSIVAIGAGAVYVVCFLVTKLSQGRS